jgi:hypothetical protein
MIRRFAQIAAGTTLILLGPAFSEALAQARLRPIVQVEADAVRLGDLIDGAGMASDIAVFGAPQPGQSGQISTSRILSAATMG